MLTMDLYLTATENAMKEMGYGTGNYFRTARRTMKGMWPLWLWKL